MKRLGMITWAGILLFSQGLWASDVDELLNLLTEKGVVRAEDAAAFRGDLAVKKQEEAGKKKDFEVAAGRLLKLNGYTQIRYQFFEDVPAGIDGFDVRRVRLDLKGDLGNGFDYRLQPEFAGSSAKLLDAAVGYEVGTYLKFTTGQFKIPFSQENLISSASLDTINRSQVVEALTARSKDIIGNQNGRDIGIKAGGNLLEVSDVGLLEYALGVFNGQGINTTDLNEQKDYVGRLVLHPFKDLSLGGSYYAGRYALSGFTGSSYERARVGAELAYVHDPFSLKAEYIRGRDGSKKGLTKKEGWYAQAGFFILPKILQGVLKYDIFDPDLNVSNNSTTVYTIGVNAFYEKWAKLQINYEIKKEEGTEKKNNVLGIQAQAAF